MRLELCCIVIGDKRVHKPGESITYHFGEVTSDNHTLKAMFHSNPRHLRNCAGRSYRRLRRFLEYGARMLTTSHRSNANQRDARKYTLSAYTSRTPVLMRNEREGIAHLFRCLGWRSRSFRCKNKWSRYWSWRKYQKSNILPKEKEERYVSKSAIALLYAFLVNSIDKQIHGQRGCWFETHGTHLLTRASCVLITASTRANCALLIFWHVRVLAAKMITRF